MRLPATHREQCERAGRSERLQRAGAAAHVAPALEVSLLPRSIRCVHRLSAPILKHRVHDDGLRKSRWSAERQPINASQPRQRRSSPYPPAEPEAAVCRTMMMP